MKKRNIGSSLESLFEELGEIEEVNLLTQKKIIVGDILERMRQTRVSKAALASRMRTSRAQLDRLLDPVNTSVTLATLARAAAALGLALKVHLDPGLPGGDARRPPRTPAARAQRRAA
jgi:antitoxin HicB